MKQFQHLSCSMSGTVMLTVRDAAGIAGRKGLQDLPKATLGALRTQGLP